MAAASTVTSTVPTSTPALQSPSLDTIRQCQAAVSRYALPLPLLRLNYDIPNAPRINIFLKCENLQPINSFKLRGATGAINAAAAAVATAAGTAVDGGINADAEVGTTGSDSRNSDHERSERENGEKHDLNSQSPGVVILRQQHGVVTASAGNMAQGVAYVARRLQLPCHVYVPSGAPQTKIDAIERLGGVVTTITFDEWWQIILTHKAPHSGHFIHPVCSRAVMTGNATIALELVRELSDVWGETTLSAVITPYGGGALSCGIAAGIRELGSVANDDSSSRLSCRNAGVYACEVGTAAPLAAALKEGKVVEIEMEASWVDGIGSRSVLNEMWPLASTLLCDSLVVTPLEIRRAVRLLVERNRIVAEGAGAASVAAALKYAERLAEEYRERCRKDASGGSHDRSKEVAVASPSTETINIVAVVSGGGIDTSVLIECLNTRYVWENDE